MTKQSPHIAVRPDWLQSYSEDALLPELPIIDAHHHLWDRPGQRYLFDELLADTRQGHNILGTVFVQSRSMYSADEHDELMKPLGEVQFANGIAAQSASGLYGQLRACAGIIGFCDLMAGDRIDHILDALIETGGKRFKGVRNQTAWHEDKAISSNPVPPVKGLLLEPSFQEAARCLGKRGLTLDVWAYHTQLAEFESLAQACPETTLILDHLGGPIGISDYAYRQQEVFAEWSASIARLSALPNVCVKLGGLAMNVGGFKFHLENVPPSSETLATAWGPYFETVIKAFGPQRCMFESNFPVDKGMVSYGVLWNAFKRMTTSYSASEKADLFFNTAARIYQLHLKPEGEA